MVGECDGKGEIEENHVGFLADTLGEGDGSLSAQQAAADEWIDLSKP